MRRLVVPATLALLLAASGSVAAASQCAAAAKTTAAQPKAKEVECVRQWRAQKKHAQIRKTFLAACQKA
jgi:hypothetical protein